MKNLLLFRRLKNVSIAKKLYFTVGIMALLIAVELFTLWFAISTLSSVRAYVGGEGLWSKAQKDAIYHLEKYGHTRNEADYEAFRSFMKVPTGDHRARIEMLKQQPDPDSARQGLIDGRNHPDDVNGMIHLFRRFYRVSYIEKAIVIWARADTISAGLFPIAEKLHAEIGAPAPSESRINALLAEIGPINAQLTQLEDDFSYTLGEGSRWLENLIKRLLLFIALTVEISGLLLTIAVSRGIQKGIGEIAGALRRVAGGDFRVRARKFSEDEIGGLADSFNRMTAELEQHVNERRQSNELLRESEERFHLLVENAKDYALFMLDTDGRIISWNTGAERITGYRANEIIGEPASVFYTEEQLKTGQARLNLEKAKAKGTWQTEGWRRRKDGTVFWADSLFTALYDDTGKLRGYAKIIRDITERKEVENALRKSEAQLAMAQQLAHIGSWEWDLVKNVFSWSEELYKIYGLSPQAETLTREKIFSLTHPADAAYIRKVIGESLRTHKSFDFYHRIVRPDRKVRVLHSRGEIIRDEEGNAIRMIGTNQDVTDRFYEDEMEKLAIAAMKSNNSVVIANASGVIEWVNEGFTKLTGYTLEDVRNTHGELLRKGGVTGLSQDSELYEQLINRKTPVVYEGKNYTQDGKEYWVITTLTPVIGQDGKVERIIAIDSDITERKRMEEDLILANRIAEHSLKKGNKALNELLKAKKELEESMHVKEQFLAKMSHEIRTPMNAISGLTELLLETNVTSEQKECIDAIKLSSDNLLSIINDILDFSKLSSGKVTLESLPFRPKEVIEGVLQTLGVTAARKGISLTASEKSSLPEYLLGDPVRLRQILLNLVSNAVKFTEKGSVSILTEKTGEADDACTLRLTVKDTGIGIPENRLSSIFESFTQASNETSRKYGGTGLGLTIVRQLVELQGGTVDVQSKVREGSAFTVTLPFKKCAPEDIPPAPVLHPWIEEKFDGARVLLAEDNELNRMLAGKVLSKWGFVLDVAENGKQAIEKLKCASYDIVLMDIQMPEMDGYEATRFIRDQMPSPVKGIPIIAMTAHAIVGEAEKCLSIGMDDYISKPFNQHALYEKMARLLRRNQDRAPALPAEPAAPAPPRSEKNFDLSYLQTIAEGNQEFVQKMISAFLAQTPRIMEDMSKFLSEKKWRELRGLAHKMRPSLDFMGIHSIRETVVRIEEYAGEQQHLDALPGMVEEVQAVCRKAMEELGKEVNT